MILCHNSTERCNLACRPELKVCFGCEKAFLEEDAIYCNKCTEWICPYCKVCGCSVSEETLKAIRAIVKTYEIYLENRCNECLDDQSQ